MLFCSVLLSKSPTNSFKRKVPDKRTTEQTSRESTSAARRDSHTRQRSSGTRVSQWCVLTPTKLAAGNKSFEPAKENKKNDFLLSGSSYSPEPLHKLVSSHRIKRQNPKRFCQLFPMINVYHHLADYKTSREDVTLSCDKKSRKFACSHEISG